MSSRQTRGTVRTDPVARTEPTDGDDNGSDQEEVPNDLRELVAQLRETVATQAAELNLLRNKDNVTRRKRVSLAPGDLLPTPIQQTPANLHFDIHKVYKTADAYADKFTGSGKNTSIGLAKLTSKLVSILEDYDAPTEYFDIINLEVEADNYNSKANRHVVGLLERLTTGKANNLVTNYTLKGDGRLCWKALNSKYMPTDFLSLSNMNREVFDCQVKGGPPDAQLDQLEKKIDSIDSVCAAPMEHQMKCAAFVAALARGDSAIYGDLVTNLTARSYSDVNSITLSEIRSLATSAYETYVQRRAFQDQHSRAVSAIIKKPPKSDGEKRKSAAKTDRDKNKIPRCRICQRKNKEEYHWHEDCPHYSTSVYAKRTAATSATTSKKKNTVTFEEVEEDA